MADATTFICAECHDTGRLCIGGIPSTGTCNAPGCAAGIARRSMADVPYDVLQKALSRVREYDARFPVEDKRWHSRAFALIEEVLSGHRWAKRIDENAAALAEMKKAQDACDHTFGDWFYPYGRYRGYSYRTCSKCRFADEHDSTD